jgi:hypothetical protein
MGHFLCDRVEDFMAAFALHVSVLQGEMPNDTNIEPVNQISYVKILREARGAASLEEEKEL